MKLRHNLNLNSEIVKKMKNLSSFEKKMKCLKRSEGKDMHDGIEVVQRGREYLARKLGRL